ncbi:MAG: family 4 glycosyl hydrolase [Armatimonadota bacterium]
MNIVLIGAGSISFGGGQIADLLQAPELRGRKGRLVLVDTDEAALATMLRLAERIKAHAGADMILEANTDRTKALPGADYVITAVARKRYPLWEQDFRVPLAYGFRHCLGENGGPGAVFHTLRSLELIMPIAQDVERLCPEALLLNFTNPEARVLHAISHLTKVRAAGICHGVFTALEFIARYTGRPWEEFHVVSAGMNHFYCLLEVTDKQTGKDRLPELVEAAVHDEDAPPLFRKMAEIFGVFTFPSDDHIGEYLSYGAEFHGVKWPYGQEYRPVGSEPEPLPLADYAAGRRPLDQEVLKPSGEVTVPIIADIELDRGSYRHAVNVLNTEGYIDNLPRRAAVEIPATVDARGLHPVHVGAIPETFAAMMRTQFAIHELITEAWQTRDKRLLLQALLLDPNVNSITAAERLLDDMLELQAAFLPSFTGVSA